MDLSFFPLTLEAIDEAAAESLCLFIAADERPLTGLAGLADWRLSGRLSRLLRSGMLTGNAGEAVLTPPGARLGFQKLFLFGVGRMDQAEDQLVARVAEALRKLSQAGVRESAMQLPARLSAETAIRTLLDELQGPGRTLLFGADPQKLVTALGQAARGQAQLERRVVKVQGPPTPASVKPVSQAAKPATPTAMPKASPLPFAPQRDLPAPQFTRPTPPAIPKAAPLPSAPAAQPLPTAPVAQPLPAAEPLPTAPVAAEPLPTTPAAPEPAPGPAAATPAPSEERRPTPPPPQRYVPPPPKPSVFDKRRKKP